MKKMLTIFIVVLVLCSSTLTCFAQSISFPASSQTQYSYNKFSSVITGYGNFNYVEISTNSFDYTPRESITSDNRSPVPVYSDVGKMICFDIYRELINDDEYYNVGTFVYDYIDYYSLNFSSYINLYNSYDNRALRYRTFPYSFFCDADISVSTQGDLYLYYSDNATESTNNEFYVYKLSLSTLTHLVETDVTVTTWDWVKSCNATIQDRYHNMTRYTMKLPHIVALEYLSNLSVDAVPIGYQYVDANITVTSSSGFGAVQNNVYTTDKSDANGDNFLTVELLAGYINDDGYPYENDFGIKSSVEEILDSPFILNISYITWLYILCGVALLSYLFKLFLGG